MREQHEKSQAANSTAEYSLDDHIIDYELRRVKERRAHEEILSGRYRQPAFIARNYNCIFFSFSLFFSFYLPSSHNHIHSYTHSHATFIYFCYIFFFNQRKKNSRKFAKKKLFFFFFLFLKRKKSKSNKKVKFGKNHRPLSSSIANHKIHCCCRQRLIL